MKMMTVEAAVAPLLKVQKNLQTVSKARTASARNKRSEAAALVERADADDAQQLQADKILVKLLALTDPED